MSIHDTDAAREAARRSDGKFGNQQHTESSVSLESTPDTVARGSAARDAEVARLDEHIAELNRRIDEIDTEQFQNQCQQMREKAETLLGDFRQGYQEQEELKRNLSYSRLRLEEMARRHYSRAGAKWPGLIAQDIVEKKLDDRNVDGTLKMIVKRSGPSAAATRDASASAADDEAFQAQLHDEAAKTQRLKELEPEVERRARDYREAKRPLDEATGELNRLRKERESTLSSRQTIAALPDGFAPQSIVAVGAVPRPRITDDGATNVAVYIGQGEGWDRLTEPAPDPAPDGGHSWRTENGRTMFFGSQRANYQTRQVGMDRQMAVMDPEEHWPEAGYPLMSSKKWDNS